MLLSEIMCQFLASDLAYGAFIIGLGVATILMNIKDDRRGK